VIQPPFLKKGDLVLLVAPARKVSMEELERPIGWLRAQGFRVEWHENLFSVHYQFAGSDAQRLESLQWALDHPEARAVWMVRGGYGCLRLVDSLTAEGLVANPKWLVGFSDGTVLHHWAQQQGLASLHATMPVLFEKEPESAIEAVAFLIGQSKPFVLPATSVQQNGFVEAPITGGNLSLLYALQGSPTLKHARGHILFLEDLDEYKYHIDRMCLSLARSGYFEGILGLILGGFTEMKDNPVPFGSEALDILLEHIPHATIPVFSGFPAGHVNPNLPIPFGIQARMEVDSHGLRLDILHQS